MPCPGMQIKIYETEEFAILFVVKTIRDVIGKILCAPMVTTVFDGRNCIIAVDKMQLCRKYSDERKY